MQHERNILKEGIGMKRILPVPALLAALLLLAGCSAPQAPAAASEPADQPGQIARLETEIQTLERDNLSLHHQIDGYSRVLPYVMADPPDMTVNASADLDGNGREESITLQLYSGHDLFLVTIDELSLMGMGSNVDSEIHLLDLNTDDPFLEVAVAESGPSDDYFTTFYRWTPEEFHTMGRVGGRPSAGITLNGDGTLTAQTRGQVLHTWFYDRDYRINRFGRLESVPTGFYPMDTPVTALVDLTLTAAPGRGEPIDVKAGESLVIEASDDISFLQIRTGEGQTGYLELEGFDRIKGTDYTGSDAFGGLNYAD
ncbi:MAG: hypothetical protein SCK57_08035 [Bacillota bacterium]|nr:hypothetical protein [Bacillota bacterium]MDW7677595.1 hypothetical protein [Bacillota bacterium]